MGSHYNGSTEEVRALDAYIKLVRAVDSINSKIRLFLSKSKLSESQFLILDALYHLGDLAQKDLAKKSLKSGGNITMVVDNLEEKGLIKRKRGESDRRIFYVHLTKTGEKLIRNVLPDFVNMLSKEMKSLNAVEQKELQRLCKKLGVMN